MNFTVFHNTPYSNVKAISDSLRLCTSPFLTHVNLSICSYKSFIVGPNFLFKFVGEFSFYLCFHNHHTVL